MWTRCPTLVLGTRGRLDGRLQVENGSRYVSFGSMTRRQLFRGLWSAQGIAGTEMALFCQTSLDRLN